MNWQQVYHRHPPPPRGTHLVSETVPLFPHKKPVARIEERGSPNDSLSGDSLDTARTTFRLVTAFFALVIVIAGVNLGVHQKDHLLSGLGYFHEHSHEPTIVPIEAAHEQWVRINKHGSMKIWFRTWGNLDTGVPILFVHGGPGNAISDYKDGNKKFFSDEDYFVVEVDQRGTGNSQPSVRESWHNMQYYQNHLRQY